MCASKTCRLEAVFVRDRSNVYFFKSCQKCVKDIHEGVFYSTRFVSPQGTLIPLTPHESLIVYRPRPTGHLGQRPQPMQQLWLFELVRTA